MYFYNVHIYLQQFQKCTIGTFLPHMPKSIDTQPQTDRGILPSFITQVTFLEIFVK